MKFEIFFVLLFLDLLNEPVARGHQGLDDYEGDDAADGQIDNQHYPVMQRKKEVKERKDERKREKKT